MANRFIENKAYSFVKGPVRVYADVKFGTWPTMSLQQHLPSSAGNDVQSAAGSTGFQGIYTVAATTVTGVLDVTFQDNYYRVLALDATWIGSVSGSPGCQISASTTATSLGKTVAVERVSFNSGTTLVAPTSGSELILGFTFQNSTAI